MTLPPAMTNPSPLLEAAQARWAGRHDLVLRDMEMARDGHSGSGRLLPGLREKIEQHRRDDLQQLTGDREETYSRWGERLTRLEEWQSSAAQLSLSSDRLIVWRASVLWFDRAKVIGRRYAAALGRRAERVEKRLAALGEQLQQWLNLLVLQEAELRGALEFQPEDTAELVITAARKRPFLEFVYMHREEEGRQALLLKFISATTDRALERLGRIEQRLGTRADANPAYFEIRKNALLDIFHPVRGRFEQLRQAIASQTARLGEGHQRLRIMYDTVHKIRVAEPPASRHRSLLQRLFNINDD